MRKWKQIVFCIFVVVLLVGCAGGSKRDNRDVVQVEYMHKVEEELADYPFYEFIDGELEVVDIKSKKVESSFFYDFFLEVEMSEAFNELTEEKKHELLWDLKYNSLTHVRVGENSFGSVETLTLFSGPDEYTIEPYLGFGVYKDGERFELLPDIQPTITTSPTQKSESAYTKEELENDPRAPSTNPEDYNSDGEYVPSGGPTDNPADYDSGGNYKPIESMTQDEIEAELKEMLGN